MLDTPLPSDEPLTMLDKLKMHGQRIANEKHRYFWNLFAGRLAWEWQQLRKRFSPSSELAPTTQFHSATIEQAFRQACEVYQTPHLAGKLVLFRPKLKPMHVFGPNRMINVDRRFIYPDNGWSRFVDEVEVHEVPGDHDGMVLEPSVRVLGAKLRRTIDQAEAAYERRHAPAPRNVAVTTEGMARGRAEVGVPWRWWGGGGGRVGSTASGPTRWRSARASLACAWRLAPTAAASAAW